MAREFEHIRRILIDTVTILCKNSIHYDRKLNVQGLIGITLDEGDVLLVHINEEYKCSVKSGVGLSGANDDLSTDSEAERSVVVLNHTENPLSVKTIESELPRRRKRKKPGKLISPNNNVNVKCSDTAVDNESDTDVYGNEKVSDLRETGSTTNNHNVSPLCILNAKIKSEQITDIVEENNMSQTVEEFFPPDNSESNYVDSVATGDANCSAQVSFKFCDTPDKAETARDLTVKTGNSRECLLTSQTTSESARRPVLGLRHRSIPYEMNYCDTASFNPSSSLDMFYGSIRERRSATATAEKTFRCDYDSCSKAYYDKKNLLRHQTRHHGRVPAFQRNIRYNADFVSFQDDYMTID